MRTLQPVRTLQWQLSFEGLTFSQESHAWTAGLRFMRKEQLFNIQQAGTRRPVRARLSQPVSAEQRLGRIVLTPAGFGMPVETVGVEEDFPVRKFEFDPEWLNHQLEGSVDFDFRLACAYPIFDEPVVAATLDRIYDELMADRPERSLVLQTLTRLLAIDTARSLLARSANSELTMRSLSSEQVARIRHLIQTTEFKDLSLAYVAGKVDVSQTRLREMFKRATGHSLRAEIEEARVATACTQLISTHHPLKVLAHHLGFTHASAFCYWFKQATGMTPTEFRIQRAVKCAGDC
jgi:AraC family transcriptional regulator